MEKKYKSRADIMKGLRPDIKKGVYLKSEKVNKKIKTPFKPNVTIWLRETNRIIRELDKLLKEEE